MFIGKAAYKLELSFCSLDVHILSIGFATYPKVYHNSFSHSITIQEAKPFQHPADIPRAAGPKDVDL